MSVMNFPLQSAIVILMLAMVNCQSPLTVCQPSIYQVNFTNLLTGDTGYLVVDFGRDLMAEISTKSNIRILMDFKNLLSYETPANSNTTCKQAKLSPCRVQQKCLPPYARLVPDRSGVVGDPRANYNIVTQTWEIPTDFDVLYRLTYTVQVGQASWPVLAQELGYHGTNRLYQYINPRPAIIDARALVIPSNCEVRDTSTAATVG